MADDKKPAKADKKIKARVLVDCGFGACGDVATVTEDELEVGKADGSLDATPAAVAYAEAELAKKAKPKAAEKALEE